MAESRVEHGTRPRVLGSVGDPAAGPTLVCLAAIHGNEPAGVHALERVFEAIDRRRLLLRGRLIGLVGHRRALDLGVRFVDEDLNRVWHPRRLRALRRDPAGGGTAEAAEQRALIERLDEVVAAARAAPFLLDLHTTSAPGPPFTVVADTLPNRRFALAFPVPLVLGLDERLGGTIADYLGERGLVCATFEAGQHDEADSVDRHESAIWIALAYAGLLGPGEAATVEEHRRRLRRAARGVAPVYEARYRYGIARGERFRMYGGFRNFDPVRRDEPLAWSDRGGTVRAPETGVLFLPLYQSRGDDGFFLVRPVRPFWLGVSAALRRARLDRWLPLLPGVRRHPRRDDVLLVDTRLARLFALELFHLLGYRRLRRRGRRLWLRKRRFDVAAPPRGDG